jgi:hypothetical protein
VVVRENVFVENVISSLLTNKMNFLLWKLGVQGVAGSEPKAHAPLVQNPAVPTKLRKVISLNIAS